MSDEERRTIGIENLLPTMTEHAHRALLCDKGMEEFFGEELLRSYVSLMQGYEHLLALVGSTDSDAQAQWLMERF